MFIALVQEKNITYILLLMQELRVCSDFCSDITLRILLLDLGSLRGHEN